MQIIRQGCRECLGFGSKEKNGTFEKAEKEKVLSTEYRVPSFGQRMGGET